MENAFYCLRHKKENMSLNNFWNISQNKQAFNIYLKTIDGLRETIFIKKSI